MGQRVHFIYKMRAECMVDVARAISALSEVSGGVYTFGANEVDGLGQMPDRLVEFTSALGLNEVRRVLAKIVDGHVMLETVQLRSEYTGERVGLPGFDGGR